MIPALLEITHRASDSKALCRIFGSSSDNSASPVPVSSKSAYGWQVSLTCRKQCYVTACQAEYAYQRELAHHHNRLAET